MENIEPESVEPEKRPEEKENEEKEEEIESQLPDEIVKILEDKGYEIGYHAGDESKNIEGDTVRVITFSHPLRDLNEKEPFDKKTTESLKEIGVEIPSNTVPQDVIRLELKVEDGDGEQEIKSKWEQVALVLPEVDSEEKIRKSFS